MMSNHSLVGAGSAGAQSAYGGLGGSNPFGSYLGDAAMGGGLAGMLGSLFGGGGFQNPADAANPYYDQIPGQLSPYYQPYIQQGQNAYGQMTSIANQLQGQYGTMANDPTGFLQKIGSQYQQSPGYQFALNQALQAGKNASAAGGVSGTPMDQQQQMQTATGLANQNYQQYLQNATGIMGQGQQGLGNLENLYSGLNQQGFQASTGLGNSLANAMMNQGNLAYQGANAQNVYNQNQSGMWGNLFGLGADMAGFL